MNQETVNKLADALVSASFAADAVDQLVGENVDYVTADGGSCNFDTPMIEPVKGVLSKQEIEAAAKKAGIEVTYLSSGFWKGNYWVRTPLNGQAMNRTRMAEAASKRLKDLGYKSAVYYAMD